MRYHFTKQQIREASGEQLLLMAVFGHDHLRPQIQKEQSRRARARQRMQQLQTQRFGASMPARAA